MKDTMANHCHRDRRSLSIRPGKRSRFVQNGPLAGLTGTEARMQATAKNPDRSKPIRAVRSFITALHRRCRSHDWRARCAATYIAYCKVEAIGDAVRWKLDTCTRKTRPRIGTAGRLARVTRTSGRQ